MKMSEQALAKMNSINPDSVLSHELSAEVMESMNNYDGAVVELKKAVEMAPQKPGTHFKLGEAPRPMGCCARPVPGGTRSRPPGIVRLIEGAAFPEQSSLF
jgi:hypothetical protein